MIKRQSLSPAAAKRIEEGREAVWEGGGGGGERSFLWFLQW